MSLILNDTLLLATVAYKPSLSMPTTILLAFMSKMILKVKTNRLLKVAVNYKIKMSKDATSLRNVNLWHMGAMHPINPKNS
jgi:hypothetical protein